MIQPKGNKWLFAVAAEVAKDVAEYAKIRKWSRVRYATIARMADNNDEELHARIAYLLVSEHGLEVLPPRSKRKK